MMNNSPAQGIANIIATAILRRTNLETPANAGVQLDFSKKRTKLTTGHRYDKKILEMEHNAQVIRQVLALPDQSLDELKALWRRLFNADAPPHSKTYLVPRLAYKLQELAYGPLPDHAVKQLDQLTDDMAKGRKSPSHYMANKPCNGTKLIREFQGVSHEVLVTDGGFVYQGQPYKSLSVIARKITGTRWSGPEFFGTKSRKKRGKDE